MTFELTENVLIDGAHTVADTMHKLAKLGVRFSIDDFGTSYFGLASLRRLPLREFKIDESFVHDICDDAKDDALVEALLSLARHRHVSAVAQGVDSVAQWSLLMVRLPANARTSVGQTLSGATRSPPLVRRRWHRALSGTVYG